MQLLRPLCLCLWIPFTLSACATSLPPVIPTQADTSVERPAGSYTPSDRRYYYYLRAQFEAREGRLDEAVQLLSAALHLDPDSIVLKKELSALHIRRNDSKKALAMVEALLEDDPMNVDGLVMLATIRQFQKAPAEELVPIYEKLVEADPDRQNIYIALARYYISEKDYDSASGIIERMLARFPDAYAGHFYQGQIAMEQGDLKTAEQKLLETISLAPDLEEPRLLLVEIYTRLGKTRKVEQMYQEILDRDPDQFSAKIALGLFYHHGKQTRKAMEIFRELGAAHQAGKPVIRHLLLGYIEKKKYRDAVLVLEGMMPQVSDDPNLHYALGVAYDGLGDTEKTILHLRKVDPASKYYMVAITHMAMLYHDRGETAEAVRLLEEARVHHPENIDMTHYLGFMYEEMEDYATASSVISAALKVSPDNVKLLYRLGVIYDKWGKKEDSMATMSRVVEVDPENANALNYLGYTYAESGIRLDEAEALISRALELKPDDGYILDSLGWVYYQKGEYSRAAEILARAAQLAQDDPLVLEHLGDAYLKTGEQEKTVEAYEKSMEMHKSEKEKARIQDKINRVSRQDAVSAP